MCEVKLLTGQQKSARFYLKGFFNMSFWEVSGKRCEFCVKKAI